MTCGKRRALIDGATRRRTRCSPTATRRPRSRVCRRVGADADGAVGQLGLDPAVEAVGTEADRAHRRPDLDEHDRPIGNEAETSTGCPRRAGSATWPRRGRPPDRRDRSSTAAAASDGVTASRCRPWPTGAGLETSSPPATIRIRAPPPTAFDLGQHGVDGAGGLVATKDPAETSTLLFDHAHPPRSAVRRGGDPVHPPGLTRRRGF